MDHSKSIYFVQGIFYQDRVTCGFGQKPEIGEAVYFTTNLYHVFFSGIIMPEPDTFGDSLEGTLQDYFGSSNLTRITFSEEKLEFIKQYDKRRDTIHYIFEKKDGDVWIGTWDGGSVGTGFAKCLITTVARDFFDPTSAAELLGITLSAGDEDLPF